MALNTALDERSEALIAAWIESGRYASAAEAVRDGLLLLERQEASDDDRLADLRAEIQAGLESGPSEPLDMETVKTEGRRRLASSRVTATNGG